MIAQTASHHLDPAYGTASRGIRALQEQVVAGAHRTGTPVLANRHLDTTVHGMLDLVFAAVDEALRPRGAKPARR